VHAPWVSKDPPKHVHGALSNAVYLQLRGVTTGRRKSGRTTVCQWQKRKAPPQVQIHRGALDRSQSRDLDDRQSHNHASTLRCDHGRACVDSVQVRRTIIKKGLAEGEAFTCMVWPSPAHAGTHAFACSWVNVACTPDGMHRLQHQSCGHHALSCATPAWQRGRCMEATMAHERFT
jgi:hypothetical protein